MSKVFFKCFLYLLMLCTGMFAYAQEDNKDVKPTKPPYMPKSGIGITIGIQPALQNEVTIPSAEAKDDFPVFFMKYFTVGIVLRNNLSKFIYTELDVNASIDAQWGYVSDGRDFIEEFQRAFDRPERIRVDIPLYLGGYVLRSSICTLRVFGSPQFRIRANTAGKRSNITWDNFAINVGAGVDLFTNVIFNLNYRIPFNHGETSFQDTRISATAGIIF